MTSIVLVIAAAILAASIVILFRCQYNLTFGLRTLALGIMLADIVMLIPVLIGGDGLAIVPLYAMQMGSLDADFEGLIALSKEMGGSLYYVFFIVLCLMSPLVLGGLVASYFESFMSRLRYVLFSPWHDVCYFSELNEHSLMLMADILRHDRNTLCVFCNCSDVEESLRRKAVKGGGILLDGPESSFCGKSSHRRAYFELSEDQGKNVEDSIGIMDAFADRKVCPVFGMVKVFIFSEQDEAELMLNSTDKHGIDVVLVDSHRVAAYNLLLSSPLFDLPGFGRKPLSLIVVGAGGIGNELVKAFTWCSCRGSRLPARITVLDREARRYGERLRQECPGFFCGEYALEFHDVDVTDSLLGSVLASHCADADYIAVALGDDSLNIRTAMQLRRWYLRQDEGSFSREPVIVACVADDFKNALVPELTAVNRERVNAKGWSIYDGQAQNYNLRTFGADRDLFSYGSIVNSDVDRVGLNCHAAYERMFSGSSVTAEDIRRSYTVSEINRRSSRANGLHLLYKLAMLGYGVKSASSATAREQEAAPAILSELRSKLEDSATMDFLTRVEHDRWNAYMRSEGYEGASVDQAKLYKNTTGSHRHLRAKLHACICSWDELNEVCSAFDPKFKEYDAVFIQKAPAVLGLEDNPDINLSGLHNILVSRKINAVL